jgi:hypothetical protein
MNTLQKLLGTHGCFIATGDSETTMPVGYAAYAVTVRIAATEITTVDELIAGVATELADASWENVALIQNDFITFENPIVSITLNDEADSVLCYLEPTDWIEPVM